MTHQKTPFTTKLYWVGRQTSKLIFIVVAVLGGAALTYGDPSKDMNAWIFRWQGLLAGLFAIFAAYFTVRQMRETDDKQQARHEEILRLQLRSELLKIERAANPTASFLFDDVRIIRELKAKISETLQKMSDIADRATVDTSLEADWIAAENELREWIAYLQGRFEDTRDRLKTKFMDDAESLFGASMMRDRVAISQRAAKGVIACRNISIISIPFAQNIQPGGLTQNLIYNKSEVEKALSHIEPIAVDLDRFTQNLMKLLSAYKSGHFTSD